MTLSYLITLILTLYFVTEGTSRYKNKVQLLPLLMRNKLKFVAYLFKKHLIKDIYVIITVPILISLSSNSLNLKISLLLLWAITQILVRTYEYLGLKSSIWLLCAPLIISSILFDETLTILISLFTYLILVLSINNVMTLPLKVSKREETLSMKALPLFLLTVLLCLVFEFSSLSTGIRLSQVIPLAILIVMLKLETLVTSKKEVIQRFQSYLSIYRIRISTIGFYILGPQIYLILKNSLMIIITLIAFIFITTTRLDTAITLTLLAIYGILSNIDLLIYHYILDTSIIYENNVTRFLITQIPTTILFSYVTIVSIDMYLPSNFKPLPLTSINFSSIIALSLIITLYLKRLMNGLKPKS